MGKRAEAAEQAQEAAGELAGVRHHVTGGAPADTDGGGAGGADRTLSDLLAVGEGFRLAEVDDRATPGVELLAGSGEKKAAKKSAKKSGKKAAKKSGKAEAKKPGKAAKQAAEAAMADGAEELATLQRMLHAEARSGGTRSLLLVVQGMDTAGKGTVVHQVVGALDPRGVALTCFGPPTPQEREHDFLWRVRRALPPPGAVGVFLRSHYEDVLVARVESLVRPATWRRRYDAINRFEAQLADRGTRVVKVMLHIAPQRHVERLGDRLERPDRRWRYDPDDAEGRRRWDDYQAAYADVLARCSTPQAPWHVVPAGRTWYARWAVQRLLLEQLRAMDLRWPEPELDVAAERERLLAT